MISGTNVEKVYLDIIITNFNAVDALRGSIEEGGGSKSVVLHCSPTSIHNLRYL